MSNNIVLLSSIAITIYLGLMVITYGIITGYHEASITRSVSRLINHLYCDGEASPTDPRFTYHKNHIMDPEGKYVTQKVIKYQPNQGSSKPITMYATHTGWSEETPFVVKTYIEKLVKQDYKSVRQNDQSEQKELKQELKAHQDLMVDEILRDKKTNKKMLPPFWR